MKQKRIKVTSEMEKEIIKDYQDGLSTLKIKEKHGISPTTTTKLLRKNGIEPRSNSVNSRKFFCDENYFEKIDTEEKAYWLGFTYADGWISKQKYGDYYGLTLSTDDSEHLYKLKKSMNSTYEIHHYVSDTAYKKETKYSVYKVCSKKIVSDLIKNGVYENKTNIVNAPPDLDNSLVPSFIRGYFDGDGSFYHYVSNQNKNIYGVKILGTEDLLDFINSYVFKELGFRINRYYKREEHQTVSSYELIGRKRCESFLDLIYKDASIYLDRKYEKYISLLK